jgi:hypothetical protein
MNIHAAGNDARTIGCIDLHTAARVSVVKYLAGRDIYHQAPSFLEQLKSEEGISVFVELQGSAGIKDD